MDGFHLKETVGAEAGVIRTIDRYLLRRYIVSLIIAVGSIMLIALIVDLVEHLNEIVESAATVKDVILYYVYFLPWIYKVIIPAAVLMAGLFTIGLMARKNEILAMKSAGISLYRIALPLLVFSFVLSLFNFYFNEEVLPPAMAERLRIKQGKIKPQGSDQSSAIYNLSKQGEGGYIYHFEIFVPGTGEARNALVQRFDGDSLRDSYRAEKMQYVKSTWILYKGAHRIFKGDREIYQSFDTLALVGAKEKPGEFEKFRGNPDDMGYRELAGYIEALKKTGSPYVRELVNLKTKLSFPFTSFIVMFICVPMASNPRRSGVAVSFAFASLISLLYVVVFKVTQSLGYSGTLSPDIAAWSINIIFLLIGIVVFVRSHK